MTRQDYGITFIQLLRTDHKTWSHNDELLTYGYDYTWTHQESSWVVPQCFRDIIHDDCKQLLFHYCIYLSTRTHSSIFHHLKVSTKLDFQEDFLFSFLWSGFTGCYIEEKKRSLGLSWIMQFFYWFFKETGKKRNIHSFFFSN